MYYFRENGDLIEKYEVSFSKEELEELIPKITLESGRIIHNEYDSTSNINVDIMRIHNYSKKSAGVQKFNDGIDIPIYHYSYDEYIEPKLVTYINMLLNGDVNAIDKIFACQDEPTIPNYANEIKKMSKEIDKIPNTKIQMKKAKLDEFQKLLNEAKLNQNRKSMKEYYLKVQSMIHLTLKDQLSKETINRTDNFFTNSIESISQVRKLLKN